MPTLDPANFREMTDYEHSVLARLLSVDFVGAEVLRELASAARVRTMDECGCLEFAPRADGSKDGRRIVAYGRGPKDIDGIPVEITLTLRGDDLLWLEFHRFSGRNDYWPQPDEWEVSRWSAAE